MSRHTALLLGTVLALTIAPQLCAQAPVALHGQTTVLPAPPDKLSRTLARRLATEAAPVKTWVFFTDKGLVAPAQRAAAFDELAATYDPRALARRQLRGANAARGGALLDERDLPLNAEYLAAVRATGARVHVTSRWLNAASVWADAQQAAALAELPFVDRLEAVARRQRVDAMNVQELGPGPFPSEPQGRSINYGLSGPQLTQINLPALHDAGYTGAGVIVGILDTGFQRTHEAFNQVGHPLVVLAEYDFVDGDGNTAVQPGDPSGQHDHGTMILGCIGAYKPGSLVGGAYNAQFVLTKTEDTTQEVPAEEDNFVAGLEFHEAHGVDMTTASLGYIDWYTQADMDGQTCVTSIAMNIHTANGVHHTNAAGNEYHDSNPNTSSLIAPADAFQCITCGAVDSSGTIAYFSSDGPTADGRVKPEVLARGVSTHTVSPGSNTSYTTADGTSLSTPLVACAVACLVQARPYWTVEQMRQRLFETSDYFVQYGTHDPLYVRGYGIVNAFLANDTCADAGIIQLDRGRYNCADTLQLLVNDCGLNQDNQAIEQVTITIASASEPAGETLVLTEAAPDAAEFLGSITTATSDLPGVLRVAPGDALTATYVDADNGAGGTNVVVTDTAVVDCTPPVISNVHAESVLPRSATIAFLVNEAVRPTVRYGLSCEYLNQSATGAFGLAPSVALNNLTDDQTYYYAVEALDEAGNLTVDPTCYSFTTPEVPDFFTQLFTTDNDLDNLSLIFTPNGSVDFYDGCNESISALPTNPTGGTGISLTDDSFSTINLPAGVTVPLYGVNYTKFYVGSNGFITFTSGDTTTGETLAKHFEQPRISALFDDLNPAAGGVVSWKQLADRIAVTWLNVPEYNQSNQNTFQIEMFFDGTIKIHYLAIAATDGLAGLSAGGGLDPDFFMSDLSLMGPCLPTPPQANDVNANTGLATPVSITLNAHDDGLPNPPGILDYIVTSLPAHGTLKDAANVVITTVPYVLPNHTKALTYTPGAIFVGTDTFTYVANDGGTPPEGGDSNTATVAVLVEVAPQLVYSWPLDTNPGWATQGQWAFGQPLGGGSHAKDPTAGRTGVNVYGYNLAGDYTNSMPRYYLTTTAIDCSDVSGVELRFWRWLGIEAGSYDHAGIEVSSNGSTWVSVWEHTGGYINESAWTQKSYNLAAVADNQATVYIRWAMGTTDGGVTYPGWNIDDVEVWGMVPPSYPVGDMDCSGVVDFGDINPFVLALTSPASYALNYPDCDIMLGDIDGSGACDFGDINPFVLLLSGN